MIKFLLILAAAFAITSTSYAQTNTLPTTGNVGIGTTSPASALHVVSTSLPQARFDYDATHGFRIYALSDGSVNFNTAALATFLTVQASNVISTAESFQQSTTLASGSFFNLNTTPTPATGLAALTTSNTGTFNTTSAAITGYGLKAVNTATISSGSNALTNVGFYATASGATKNYAAIFDQGNVGIGTTTPTSLLNVGIASTYPWTGSKMEVNSTFRVFDGNSSSYGMRFGFTSNTPYIDSYRETVGVVPFALNPSGGNVGIGTIAPAYPLDVSGVAASSANFRKNTNGTPAVNDNFDIFNAYVGGSNGSVFSLPYFKIAGTVKSVASVLSNVDVSFYQNNTSSGIPFAALTLQGGTGYMGVGTTAPITSLDVRSASSNIAHFQNTGTGSIPLNFYGDSGVAGITSDNALNGTGFRIGASNYFTVQTGGAEQLRVTSAGTGIGTTTPKAQLDVSGATFTGGNAANIGVSDISYLQNSGKLLLGWNRSASEGETDFIANQGLGNNGGFSFYNYDNSGTQSILMRIKGSNGFVGIGGVTNPDQMLTVNGSTHTKEVLVNTTGFPDYVFKPDYKLPALKDLKAYIDQNHHLPEVPTEADVLKNGLKLGEMNVLLTKKVEELTLYLIEQNKQLQEQQKVNQSLQQQIDRLAKLIKN